MGAKLVPYGVAGTVQCNIWSTSLPRQIFL